jgi:hypothetical protein
MRNGAVGSPVNRDPFLRAGLILLLTGAAAVLFAFFGPWRALILAAVGIVGALFVSVDYSQPPPTREELKARVRPSTDAEGKPRDFERLRG